MCYVDIRYMYLYIELYIPNLEKTNPWVAIGDGPMTMTKTKRGPGAVHCTAYISIITSPTFIYFFITMIYDTVGTAA